MTTATQITSCPHDNRNSNYSLSTWWPQLNYSLSICMIWQPQLKLLPIHMTSTTQITPCPHDNHNSNYSLSTWQPKLKLLPVHMTTTTQLLPVHMTTTTQITPGPHIKLLPVHMTTTTQITPCPHDNHNSNYILSTWQPQLKLLPVHMTTITQTTPCPHDNHNLHHSLSTCLLQLKSVPVHMSTTTGLKLTNLFAYLSHRGVMACGAVHFLSQVTAAWNNTATAFKGMYSLLYTVQCMLESHTSRYAATQSQSIALKWTLQRQMVLSSKLVHIF